MVEVVGVEALAEETSIAVLLAHRHARLRRDVATRPIEMTSALGVRWTLMCLAVVVDNAWMIAELLHGAVRHMFALPRLLPDVVGTRLRDPERLHADETAEVVAQGEK